MSDVIRNALLSGLGLASLTKDAIQKTAEDVAKKSNLSEEEGRRLVKDLHRRSTKAQKDLQKTVETAVNKLLKNLNLTIVRDSVKSPKAAGKPAKKNRRRGSASKAVNT
jgi:polyhydroxyalkanoate synthesis regulator phasin